MATRPLNSILGLQTGYVDDANAVLGLTYAQIATALGTSERTLQQWREGAVEPTATDIQRLEALRELQDQLLQAVRRESVRAWLQANVSALGGRRPIDLLLVGDIEEVTRSLLRLNAGFGV